MTDSIIVSGNNNDLDSLRQPLITGSVQVQQQVIPQLANLGDGGLDILMEFLYERRNQTATLVDGKAYVFLYNSDSIKAKGIFANTFFSRNCTFKIRVWY